MKPMRMLILLAVTWVVGSLLFAAEQLTSRTPPAAGQTAQIRAAPAATPPAAATTQGESNPPAAQSAETKPEGRAPESKAEPAPAPPAAGGEAAQSKPATADEEESATAPKAPATANSGPSPQRFVPSEQVRADFDVSFPIDI